MKFIRHSEQAQRAWETYNLADETTQGFYFHMAMAHQELLLAKIHEAREKEKAAAVTATPLTFLKRIKLIVDKLFLYITRRKENCQDDGYRVSDLRK